MSLRYYGRTPMRSRPYGRRRICCGLTVKEFVQIIGSFLLPLLLAIFTVVITVEQRNENRIQRMEDRRLAAEQREQDLNDTQELRKFDKESAQNKIDADNLNAAIQRNMTRDQRSYEFHVEQQRHTQEHERYLDALLLSYFNEMGQILKETNDSLASSKTYSSLARAKTLNVIQQIGPKRSKDLIKFLYDAGQLTVNKAPLDISGAQLNIIDLSSQVTLKNISLAGTHLNHASFAGRDMSNGNFKGAQLMGANFTRSICRHAYFDSAYLTDADFSYTDISGASFQHVHLQGSTFYKANGSDVLFQFARMQNTNFAHVHLTFNQQTTTGFVDSNLAASIFHYAILKQSPFIFCNMTQVDFTKATFEQAILIGSLLQYALFNNAKFGISFIEGANFSHANLYNATWPYAHLTLNWNPALSIDKAILPNGTRGAPSPPLLFNGYPQCDSSTSEWISAPIDTHTRWNVNPPGTVVSRNRNTSISSDWAKTRCIYTSINTFLPFNMTQRVDLSHYARLIKSKRAKITVRSFISLTTLIKLIQYNKNQQILKQEGALGVISHELLDSETSTILIIITPSNPSTGNEMWVEYVELYLESDIKAPDTQLLYPYQSKEL